MKKFFLLSTIVLMLVFAVFMVAPTQVPAKTLKIGAVTNLGWPLGINFQRLLESYIPALNEKEGGLNIGGEKYKIEIILYDTKMSPETGRAAVERLVFRDKVKFILGDETVEAWMPITEKNKVVAVAATPSPKIFDPKWKYTFQGSEVQTHGVTAWGWFAEKYPEVKTFMGIYPDAIHGRMEDKFAERAGQVFGMKKLKGTFYKPDTTDFSAIATKVKRANPDMFTFAAGGPVQDSLLMKSVRESGYKGIIFSQISISVLNIAKVISLDKVEGVINGIVGYHLEDIPSPHGRLFKEAYTKKYGKWDEPEGPHVHTARVLLAGLEQAGSTDPDKVAETLSSGIKFMALGGHAVMVARPDLGINRTVDTLRQSYMKKIEGGKGRLIDTITIEEGLKYNKRFYGWQ